jgi:3-methylcrotonyl-CoA carboxylase alpha subunit
VRPRGHAIQCRVYAEDPANGFLPSTGSVTTFAPPEGAGIRNDAGVQTGDTISSFYDPMLAKLLVVAGTRADAVARTAEALRRYDVRGVTTNIPLLLATVTHPAFLAGNTYTSFLDEHILPALSSEPPPSDAFLVAALVAAQSPAPSRGHPWQSGWRTLGAARGLAIRCGDVVHSVRVSRVGAETWVARGLDQSEHATLSANGDAVEVRRGEQSDRLRVIRRGPEIEVRRDSQSWRFQIEPPPEIAAASHGAHAGTGARSVTAPLTGVVVKVAVKQGDAVRAGQPLVVLEAMKMEHTMTAPSDATVSRVAAEVGELVQSGAMLIELDDA